MHFDNATADEVAHKPKTRISKLRPKSYFGENYGFHKNCNVCSFF